MRIVLGTVGIALLTVLLLPPIAEAQSASEIRDQIQRHNEQIEALNKEIAQYEKQLNEVGAKKQTLQNTLAEIDLSRKKIAASINVTKNKIATLELEIENLARGISSAEDTIRIHEEGLGESIRRLNEVEGTSLITVLLSDNGINSVWDDVESTLRLQNAIQADIEKLSAEKITLTNTKTETERKQSELVVQQKKLVAEQGSLDATRKAQNELLAQTKSKETTFQAILNEKQAAKAVFEKSLEDLESKLQFTLDPKTVPAAGKGILHWPLDNVVNAVCNASNAKGNAACITQYFGKTADSGRLYVSGTHNGVDFRASIGTPVKAALSGTIIGSGNTDGGGCYSYGKWILIRHGNGLSTLYGHLSQINVSNGDSVSTGEVIGYSGFTGYATGPHLHFTLFASEGVQVKDLGQWYRENGQPATTACAKKGAIIPVAAQSAYLDPMLYL